MVIAILGILAGVGTVAYSGYVKRANKAVDQQLVGDIAYAIQLADYANPGLLDGQVGMVVLTDTGVPSSTISSGEDANAAFKSALEDAIPDLESARLKYDWGVNTATVSTILSSLGETGLGEALQMKDENGQTATVSYATNANQMWDAVSELSKLLEDNDGNGKTAGEYVAKVAQYSSSNIDKDTMIKGWSDFDQLLDFAMSDASQAAIPAYAAALARNFAFVEYLKNSTDVELSENDVAILQNYKNEDGEIDYYAALFLGQDLADEENCTDEDFKEAYGIDADVAALREEFKTYTTKPVYNDGNQSYTQAELDGLAYYTLMQNVANISAEGEDGSAPTYDPKSDSYLSDLSGYVTMAGQICSGKLDTDALQAALSNASGATNTVIILAQKSGDVMTISVTPMGAWTGGEN